MTSDEHIRMIREAQRECARRRAAGEGYIYVAELVGTDVIKIGFSLNPRERVHTLGRRFRLMGYFRASLKAERQLHRLLKDRRHQGSDRQELYARQVFAEAA